MIQNIAAVSFAKRRKKDNERQLTDEVGVLCARDALLAREVARAVLRVAAAGRPRSFLDLADRVPETVTLANEVTIGPKKIRRILPSTGGRVDWQFVGPGFCLIVEVKLGAAVGEDQLERYLKHRAITKGSVTGGLVLLTRDRSPITRKIAKKKRWLGQISWRELLPELENIEPADPAVRAEWKQLVEVIQQPGDLVADGVTWQRKNRTAGQRNRAILGAAHDGACDFVELNLATRLGGRPEGRCGTHPPGHRHRDVTYRGDRAVVGFYVPARSKRPAITVDVDGIRQPLKVTTTFLLNRHALGCAGPGTRLLGVAVHPFSPPTVNWSGVLARRVLFTRLAWQVLISWALCVDFRTLERPARTGLRGGEGVEQIVQGFG